MANLKTVLEQAYELSTQDKVRLIEKVSPRIEEELRSGQKPGSYPSLFGVCRGVGPVPSEAEIQQTRGEMWD